MKCLNAIKIAILILLFQGFSTECEAQGKYEINGAVSGITNGQIYVFSGNKMDSVQVKDGKFQISGEIKEPVSSIAIAQNSDPRKMSQKSYLQLFVEARPMVLQLNYTDFSEGKLTGSKTQNDAVRYTSLIKRIQSKYKKEMERFESVRSKYNAAAAAKKSDDILEAIKLEDNEVRGYLEPMFNEIKDSTLKFIRENPQSYYSLYLFTMSFRDLNYKEAQSYFNSLNPIYKKGKLATDLLEEIEGMKKGIAGAAAGDFNTKDINGNPIKLEDFKGQYVLIDFWASWCVPCRKGNPHLLKLYAKYKPKGLEILGVSDDDRDEDKWKKAVEKDGIGVWRHVLRGLEYKEGTHERINVERDISEGYNISSLPTKILVGPDGIIIARYNGSEQDDKKMDEDLALIFDKK
ncbi:TlpA disulfide reductase family protein [Pedobacter agri]|uniref:TlpA disulfide reductase family protein n=1 Tax=Pedobacter agri TaxID=454586 RepID=UPI0029318372|nr:TlpA disulfide reductase family protein [Pedobacter agri]